MSFLAKTVLGVAGIEATLLLLLLVSSNHSLERSLVEALHTRANTTVALLDTTARDAIFSKDLATLESFVQHAITTPDVAFVRIQETDGTVLAEAGNPLYLTRGQLRTPDTVQSALDDGVYDARVAVTEGGITYAYIEMGLSTLYSEEAKRNARNRNLIIAATELLLVALFSILLGRYLTQELSRMKDATGAIAKGDFGFQVPVSGHDEIADTIRSFNEMSLQVHRYHQEQKKSRRKEAEGRNRLLGILSTISEGVLLLNVDLVVEYANPLGHSFLGFLSTEDHNEQPLSTLAGQSIQQLLASSRAPTQELTVHIQELERVFEFSAALVSHAEPVVEWVIVLRDVTQKRQSIERAKKQARLAAVGQLSAGIAHDFNNILSVIIGVSDLNLSRESDELPEDLREDLAVILDQGQRASELVRHMLDYSRKEHQSEDTPIELNAFLSDLIGLLSRTLPATVSLSFIPHNTEVWTHFNTTQLQQVVTNVVMNAVDAMDETGAIGLHLHFEPTDKANARPLQGEWVCLSISDNGSGIEDKDLPHIFEPFFTTKPVGKGTGLGLAQAYELMQKYGGNLEVQSERGIGTTFTLYFEVLRDEASSLKNITDEAQLHRTYGAILQNKRILLIDDDVEVRSAIKAMLERIGCILTEAENGKDGIAQVTAATTPFDAILSDVVMPVMGGAEMVVRLRTQYGCTSPIALLSGYIPEEEVDVKALKEHIDGFIHKPVDFRTLTALVGHLVQPSIDSPSPPFYDAS